MTDVADFSRLSLLTEAQLVKLIKEAGAELAARLDRQQIDRIPTPRVVVTMREPSEDQKDFVLMLKARLKKGEYIKAGERREAAAIAERVPRVDALAANAGRARNLGVESCEGVSFNNPRKRKVVHCPCYPQPAEQAAQKIVDV